MGSNLEKLVDSLIDRIPGIIREREQEKEKIRLYTSYEEGISVIYAQIEKDTIVGLTIILPNEIKFRGKIKFDNQKHMYEVQLNAKNIYEIYFWGYRKDSYFITGPRRMVVKNKYTILSQDYSTLLQTTLVDQE